MFFLLSVLGLSIAGPYPFQPTYKDEGITSNHQLEEMLQYSNMQSDEYPDEEQEENTAKNDNDQDEFPEEKGYDDVTSRDDVEIQVHYQNEWDGILHTTCAKGYGLYQVQSVHNSFYEDRRWRFDCRRVSQQQLSRIAFYNLVLCYFRLYLPLVCNAAGFITSMITTIQ